MSASNLCDFRLVFDVVVDAGFAAIHSTFLLNPSTMLNNNYRLSNVLMPLFSSSFSLDRQHWQHLNSDWIHAHLTSTYFHYSVFLKAFQVYLWSRQMLDDFVNHTENDKKKYNEKYQLNLKNVQMHSRCNNKMSVLRTQVLCRLDTNWHTANNRGQMNWFLVRRLDQLRSKYKEYESVTIRNRGNSICNVFDSLLLWFHTK